MDKEEIKNSHYQTYKATIKRYQQANQEKINKYYRDKRLVLKLAKEKEFILDYIKNKLEN